VSRIGAVLDVDVPFEKLFWLKLCCAAGENVKGSLWGALTSGRLKAKPKLHKSTADEREFNGRYKPAPSKQNHSKMHWLFGSDTAFHLKARIAYTSRNCLSRS